MNATELRVGTLAALAGLELATSARLGMLLAHHDPQEAFAVAAGRLVPDPNVVPLLQGEVAAAWKASAARRDPGEWGARCAGCGIGAVCLRDDEFPVALRVDPQPPAILFFRGDWRPLARRRVGIVGTRNATTVGLHTARRLGADLATEGVAIVSGLARGVDAAAHRGALGVDGATVVGVVANGLDTPYPRENAELWNAVAARGLLLSEWPPGTEPARFRFPQRNRLIAALSEIVVVVESRERGGSLTTAREALDRSIEVMAVPGSVENRAASGTNQLIRDGATPVLGAADVLLALGLDHQRAPGRSFDTRALPRGLEAKVLDRCRAGPCTLDHVASDLTLSVTDAALTLARLERSGWLRESGGWFEEVLV